MFFAKTFVLLSFPNVIIENKLSGPINNLIYPKKNIRKLFFFFKNNQERTPESATPTTRPKTWRKRSNTTTIHSPNTATRIFWKKSSKSNARSRSKRCWPTWTRKRLRRKRPWEMMRTRAETSHLQWSITTKVIFLYIFYLYLPKYLSH